MTAAIRIKGLGGLALGAITAALFVAAGVSTGADSQGARGLQKREPGVLASKIDKHVNDRLKAENVPASALADDAEFLRRAYLDITGVIPPSDKVVAFLDSKDPQKRSKLIDELLASPAYGRHMADIWQALLLPRNSDNRRLDPAHLVKWLETSFNENKSWDKLVYELMTATGPVDENGASVFWIANPTADKVTDSASRLFLGVQLQCAQCHNHPFNGWKQEEYWAMAAFFSKVRMNGNAKNADKKGITLAVTENGKGKQARLPESAKVVPARFFQGDEPKLSSSEPYRPVLAKWMTAPENPFFARAMANRMWAHFFGRGIVNPVDDMTSAKEAAKGQANSLPTHPELLEELGSQFVANGFDVKQLIRAICNSQTYQRTSKPLPGNEADSTFYSHMAIKPMTPEQMYDSFELVLGRVEPERGKGKQPVNKRGPATGRAAFVAFFQGDENADPTVYQAGIPQALRLMNDPLTSRRTGLVDDVLKQASTPEERLERIYLATLARRPTAEEVKRLSTHVTQGDPRQAYADVFWAILNSSEFTLNH